MTQERDESIAELDRRNSKDALERRLVFATEEMSATLKAIHAKLSPYKPDMAGLRNPEGDHRS